MKLPSLNYLASNARQSFLRFPFSVISSLVAAVIGIYLNEQQDDILNKLPYVNVMLCAALGISLFFCANVYSDTRLHDTRKRLLFNSLAVFVLVALYFTLPDSNSTQNTSVPYIRYGIYSIIMHLLVAFVPFLKAGKLNGFWHYNKILFVRFLTSLLYSAFLYGGLALALGSLDFLFDMDLHNELFFDLFILIGLFFNTWFFVTGIPTNFNSLDDIQEYPKGIKIFSQYVLLSLLIIYLIILYAYASKIVFLWSWPKGIVSYLIACVAVLGILTLLLIHPYGNLQGNAWIKKFSRSYYFILFPLVILLFIAIGMRIADYGVTINRYVIVLLGIWLTIVCAYFAIGKTNIKFIPISLAVILMAMTFGYWGMFSVSERSQVARLKSILEENKILRNGKVQHEVIWLKDSLPTIYTTSKEDINEVLLTDSLHNEIKSIIDYLNNHHGFTIIRDWYAQDIDSMVRINNIQNDQQWNRIDESAMYMRSLGLEDRYLYNERNTYFSFSTLESSVINVQGYDYLTRLNDNSFFFLGAEKVTVHYPKLSGDKLLLMAGVDTVTFQMDSLIAKLVSKYGREYKSEMPVSEMTLHSTSRKLNAKLQLRQIGFTQSHDSLKVDNIFGDLLIRKK